MRLSLRKAVTVAACVALILCLNVLIGLKFGLSGAENSKKVLGQVLLSKRDNGGTPPLSRDVPTQMGQRSAQSIVTPTLVEKIKNSSLTRRMREKSGARIGGFGQRDAVTVRGKAEGGNPLVSTGQSGGVFATCWIVVKGNMFRSIFQTLREFF